MRKLVIPATICTLALVGAVLLLLPVEDAMAVHTTIATNINKQDRYIAFHISANTTGGADIVIIPAKSGQTLKVEITTIEVDGAGGDDATFETTASVAVTVGAIRTLASGVGLQIAVLDADTEHFVSVIVAEDGE